MNKQYILFDLDGTITDSALGITNSVCYALQELNEKPLSQKTLRRFIGPPLLDAFMEYCGMDKDKAAKAVAKYRERYKDIGIFECNVYSGIPEVLKALNDANKSVILATAKPIEFAKRIIEHFGLSEYFSDMVGANFSGNLIHKHEIIAEVIKRFNITDRASAIMIGDREQDISGAKMFSLESIGVRYGFAEENELEDAGADYIAETPCLSFKESKGLNVVLIKQFSC